MKGVPPETKGNPPWPEGDPVAVPGLHTGKGACAFGGNSVYCAECRVPSAECRVPSAECRVPSAEYAQARCRVVMQLV
jgi:hypothetical protein